jgi:hypothetical protein
MPITVSRSTAPAFERFHGFLRALPAEQQVLVGVETIGHYPPLGITNSQAAAPPGVVTGGSCPMLNAGSAAKTLYPAHEHPRMATTTTRALGTDRGAEPRTRSARGVARIRASG